MNGSVRARKTWRTLEPLHGMIYFAPEAAAEYARLGITGRAGYFASRASPMGEVGPDVVASTFYNFNPDVVAAAIPSSWESASPAVSESIPSQSGPGPRCRGGPRRDHDRARRGSGRFVHDDPTSRTRSPGSSERKRLGMA